MRRAPDRWEIDPDGIISYDSWMRRGANYRVVIANVYQDAITYAYNNRLCAATRTDFLNNYQHPDGQKWSTKL